MGTMELRRARILLAVGLLTACGDSPQGRTFFERNIKPILDEKCSGNTSGCHAIFRDPATGVEDPFAIVAGNLDVTSFENVSKRRDTLAPFGAFPYPLLLIKAVGPGKLQFEYQGELRPIDVQHSGGALIEVGSDAYFTLQTWMDNGATENGLRPATPAVVGNGPCTSDLPPNFDPAAFNTMPGFAGFKATVQPILSAHGCTAGSCHGAPQSDFFLTSGETDDQVAFNFSQAWSFVHDTGTPGAPAVTDSPLLRIPLGRNGGGRGHTGGDQFASVDDADYVTIKAWAETVGELDFAQGDPLKQFFEDNVQPIFVQRGCAFQACHSPQATNDFKLRTGTVGFFSSVQLRKNYELFRNEFMAIEFPDSRRGRAVAKAILDDDDQRVPTGVLGIIHRGGPVLETPGPLNGADPAACPTHPFDPQVTATTPFCIVQEWVARERDTLIAAGQATDFGATGARIIFVQRPAASADTGRLDFDSFRGGAQLLSINATFDALGNITAPIDISGATDIATGCGLGGSPDIQSPNVANDGDRVVFAARATGTDPLGVFVVSLSANTCQRVMPPQAAQGGIQIHDFDPVFSPDGTYIVFASTRGKAGPFKSRKRFLPQSDLWRIRINGLTPDAASIEQMTFLSNSELGPAFMREGRVTMTTEKASAGFYQLSGRRINWDLTDYHPLLAQRKDSRFNDPTMADLATTNPSIGFSSATDIVEGNNGDFLLVLSNVDPTTGTPAVPGAAGALAIFNRSIGPFEAGRNDVGFLKSLRILDGDGATAGGPGYRRPRLLPDGRIMVSFATAASSGQFSIVTVDPRTGTRAPLLTGGTGAQVDAVLAYKYPARELYANRRQLVFGGGVFNAPTDAVLHMPDAPMVFTVLVANLRRGRPIEEFGRGRAIEILTEGTCPKAANCSANSMGIFESRQSLGRVPLADDGSAKIAVPSGTGLVFRLLDGDGNEVAIMGEEHQFGPGEAVSMGVSRNLFDAICGGCHGSITAREIDVAVTPDALTGASQSLSLTAAPVAPR